MPSRSPPTSLKISTTPGSTSPSIRSGRHGSKTSLEDARYSVEEDARDGQGHSRSSYLNERSPLLSPALSSDEDTTRDRDAGSVPPHTHDDSEESKSSLYLILLTISIGGLQIAWTTELSNGTPYLLSLGLSKSLMALVWIAGPISGTLVQPYVGIRSDNCRVSWGKRKPFMLGGAAATIVCLLALAWTRELVHGALGVFGADPQSQGVKVVTIIVAVIFVYVLDFAINTVQAGIRAFIVDCAPTHQQEDANAWASRITGIGSILGYLSGYVNLPEIMPFFGNTQFKDLCVITSLALGSTVVLSCIFIRERDPRLEGPPENKGTGILSFFRQVFVSIRRLPPQIKKVCEVQFFAWMAWFPFLFYITTYIGQLYANPLFEENPNMSEEEIEVVWARATRVGTFSLLIFAITSFAGNILLPFFVAPSFANSRPVVEDNKGTKFSLSCNSILQKLVISSLTLRRAWFIGHLIFAASMVLTFFVRTPVGGTVLIGFVGFSWAMTLWAPFALISAEISKRDAIRRGRLRIQPSSPAASAVLEEGEDQAGIVLGLHNVAIAAPQIVATLVSSAIFRFLQKPRGQPGDESVGWVLRVSAFAALAAAWFTLRVAEERDINANLVGVELGDEERGLVQGRE
ncbi:MAG: hypothetical protein M4579_006736 [Chaenotheca gracillima]|nr:MAG: hypothetical protein M4579_006736 [Chaenotheca gracillima]